MPRVSVNKKQYKLTDFCKWLRGELILNGNTQEDVAGWLGITQQAVSAKFKNGNFDLMDIITIFEHLDIDPSKVGKMLTF